MKPTRQGPTHAIDWDGVRARLARAAVVNVGETRLSPEEARAIMDERGRALARIPPKPPAASEVLEVAIFALADERYAIEMRHIRKVVRLQELAWAPGAVNAAAEALTPVPGAPESLAGVINFRGEILAVFDLRSFFGLSGGEVTDLSRIVVLGESRDEYGVLVDAALDVATLRVDDVLEPPGTIAGTRRGYLRGVTPDALIVLDGSALLQDRRLIIDQGEEAAGS